MASHPITSWQINGDTMETVLFGGKRGLKAHQSLHMVTAAKKLKDAYSLKKSYDQPRQHIKKQRHYFATNIHLVKAMVFPAVMYGCESWTINMTECQRIDAFGLWCWRRFLRVS